MCGVVLQSSKREMLLSMALDHGLVGYVTAVAAQWATAGETSMWFRDKAYHG